MSASLTVSSHLVTAISASPIDHQSEWGQNEDEPVTGWDCYRLTPVCWCWCWLTTSTETGENRLKKDATLRIDMLRHYHRVRPLREPGLIGYLNVFSTLKGGQIWTVKQISQSADFIDYQLNTISELISEISSCSVWTLSDPHVTLREVASITCYYGCN